MGMCCTLHQEAHDGPQGVQVPLYTVYGGNTSPAPVHIWVLEELQRLVQPFDILVKPSDGGTVNRGGSFG